MVTPAAAGPAPFGTSVPRWNWKCARSLNVHIRSTPQFPLSTLRAPAISAISKSSRNTSTPWRTATKRHFADVADMNCTAAQSRITAAWLSFADLDASGHSVAQSAIEQLVVLEAELGIAAPPTIYQLQHVANWTGKRLKQMIAAGASAPFAARVLSARASIQSLPWQTRLLLSSLAAPVWADEDVPGMSELSIEDAQRCILVADATPVNRRLEIVASALKDPAALAVDWGISGPAPSRPAWSGRSSI